MKQKLLISDLPIQGKKVLMRVDFNVPLDSGGRIVDDTRISASLRSIKYVIEQGGSLILMSHLGRPKGKWVETLSLAPCARDLSNMLGIEVKMAPDCVGPKVKNMVDALRPGEVVLLENLRFHSAEEHPEEDPHFAKELAELGDLYVNDAFGTAHRHHSSTVTIAQYFPGAAAAGFLLEKEIRFLGATVLHPKRPFMAIIGGAKISSKLGVLRALLSKVDVLIIGGGMAYTFLKQEGYEIGDSIYEKDLIEEAGHILSEAKKVGVNIVLPVDHLVAESVCQGAATHVVSREEGIPISEYGVDIGPKTVDIIKETLQPAETIFWNGPLGIFEIDTFSEGTKQIAKFIANSSAITIVGGGDSIAAVQAVGYADKISHVSTGGGASTEFIEKGILPAIDALSDMKKTGVKN